MKKSSPLRARREFARRASATGWVRSTPQPPTGNPLARRNVRPVVLDGVCIDAVLNARPDPPEGVIAHLLSEHLGRDVGLVQTNAPAASQDIGCICVGGGVVVVEVVVSGGGCVGVVASGELSPHPAATRTTPSAATASALTVATLRMAQTTAAPSSRKHGSFPLECVGHEFESESRITASAKSGKARAVGSLTSTSRARELHADQERGARE